jgi:cell filamentation protein
VTIDPALADLGTRTLPGGYDLADLQFFHQEIFGDIYPWAGVPTVSTRR